MALPKSRAFHTVAEFCYIGSMPTSDAFATYHAQLIEASNDCVDRLVINCYFQLGQDRRRISHLLAHLERR